MSPALVWIVATAASGLAIGALDHGLQRDPIAGA
jgi:hypothetical protein